MTAFADASAVVKRYADEAGADIVRALGPLVIADVSRVEVPAALWRKHREGALTAAQARLLARRFEADCRSAGADALVAVATRADVLDHAAHLVAVHPLRAYDAVQLASAIAAREADPACAAFVAFDTALNSAAAAEGFELLGP